MKKLGILFGSFFKIGFFTFGGGYAMLALLENEFVIRRKWISREDFLTMTAISKSTPPPWQSTVLLILVSRWVVLQAH